jgi:hypothetical protein
MHSFLNSDTFTYTANVYRQMTDELIFRSVISTQRWNQKIVYSRMCYQQEKYIDNYSEVCFLSKECTQ